MTLDELNDTLRGIAWFSRLGQFLPTLGFRAINDYAAWEWFTRAASCEGFGLAVNTLNDSPEVRVLSEMEWLPTTADSPDPFHGESLNEWALQRCFVEKLREARRNAHRSASMSLRSLLATRWLRVGPTDYTEAARQGALFAVRCAASEVFVGEPGRWCELLRVYTGGNWPMGLLATGDVVVV